MPNAKSMFPSSPCHRRKRDRPDPHVILTMHSTRQTTCTGELCLDKTLVIEQHQTTRTSTATIGCCRSDRGRPQTAPGRSARARHVRAAPRTLAHPPRLRQAAQPRYSKHLPASARLVADLQGARIDLHWRRRARRRGRLRRPAPMPWPPAAPTSGIVAVIDAKQGIGGRRGVPAPCKRSPL